MARAWNRHYRAVGHLLLHLLRRLLCEEPTISAADI